MTMSFDLSTPWPVNISIPFLIAQKPGNMTHLKVHIWCDAIVGIPFFFVSQSEEKVYPVIGLKCIMFTNLILVDLIYYYGFRLSLDARDSNAYVFRAKQMCAMQNFPRF